MNDVLVGAGVLALGVLLLFWGGVALRALIGLLGALIGFGLGAQLGQELAGGELLGSFWSWAAAIVAAIVVGVLAYLWYWIGVVLWVAVVGYQLGVVLAQALGADESWVLTAAGIAVAVALVVVAVVAHLPLLLLVLVSAWAGAHLAVSAAMVLVGEIGSRNLDDAFGTADPAWPWYLAAFVLFAVGSVVQLTTTARRSTTPTGTTEPN